MLTIRIADTRDVKDIALLSNQLGYPCSADAARKFLDDLNQDPDHAVLVADSDDHGLVGWVHACIYYQAAVYGPFY